MLESQFERKIVRRLTNMFPGCVIIKLDPSRNQGIPDRLLLWGPHWATLEIKAHRTARRQPNQDWHIAKLDEMSFAAFIHPENEEEVLCDLQRTFESRGDSCLSQCE